MKKFFVLVLFITSSQLFAQKIPFQGRLLDNGKPFNGTSTIEFSITSPSWTETKSDVSVQDGYYSVILGETIPLPDTLFSLSPEVQLDITINGEQLSPVILYSPFLPYLPEGIIESDSIKSNSVQVLGPDGKLKADLNFFEPNNSGSVVLYGANDSTKVILGSASGGYSGFLGLYDSLRNLGVRLDSRNDGGFLRLSNINNEGTIFESAITAQSFGDDSFLSLSGKNATQDGATTLLSLYGHNDTGSPEYRRGGINIRNYYGAFTHDFFSIEEDNISKSAIGLSTSASGSQSSQTVFIYSGDSIKGANGEFLGKGISRASLGISQNSDGADSDGTSGFLEIFGNESVNIQFGSESHLDHDLSTINMYGSIDSGDGWWFNTAQFNTARTDDGTQEFGNVNLYNNAAGNSNPSTWLSGNMFESGGGGLILRDQNATDRIFLNASDGSIASRRSDGGDAVYFYINTDNGGIGVKNSADVNKFNFDSGSGILNLSDDTGTSTIDLDGNLGNISASGNVSANTLASTDGTVQSSDRRLKKEIQDLTDPLEKTLKMRGVSYSWKDQNKSQRKQIGVIAQEVEEIYPEFVHTDTKGMKAVNYAQISAVLIEAIKELNNKVEELEKENSSLKSSLVKIESLRTDMDRLIKMLGNGKAASK